MSQQVPTLRWYDHPLLSLQLLRTRGLLDILEAAFLALNELLYS